MMAPPGEETGFWGKPTATIDWCERNYEVSFFVAEFWNTVSNLMFIIPPLAAAFHLRNRVDRVFLLSLVYMAFTGMGSSAFHGTLLYGMQLWDELSMVWSGLVILYLIIKILFGDKTAARSLLPLLAYGILTCTVYLHSNTPVIFQLAYAVIHFSVVILAYRIKHRYAVDMRLYWGTVCLSSAGFLLWNIDNTMCPTLEGVRTTLRSSSSTAVLVPVTQFHALWHCFAGYGAFCMVLFVIQGRLFALRQLSSLSLHPLSGLSLQQVQSLTITTTTGEEVEGGGDQGRGYADEGEIVTRKDAPSPGTVRIISNAVSNGYTHFVKSYHNRKRD